MRFATLWYVGPVSLCTNAQSDSMSVKLLTEHGLEFVSLKGGCTGSYESKSHVAAQFMIYWLQAYAYVHISKKRKISDKYHKSRSHAYSAPFHARVH